MTTDPIADLLTRMRNVITIKRKVVEVPKSKMNLQILKVLKDKGYIHQIEVVDKAPQGSIIVTLRYTPDTNQPAIKELTRKSKPGLRQYIKAANLPHVYNGLGIAILSTSQGVMSDKEARKAGIGGELLCHVY